MIAQRKRVGDSCANCRNGSRVTKAVVMTSVSVAMATFNGARYIRQQLASLAAQSHLPLELVVTDDGSTDGTLNLVDEFATHAPFPVFVHRNKTRLGHRANFLQAAIFCTSDLVAFCDQDDVWDRRKVEVLVPLFNNPDVLLAYHDAIATTSDGRLIGSLEHWAPPQLINPPMSIGPWAVAHGFTQIFRRSLPLLPDLWATSFDFFEMGQRMTHDQWFFFFSSVLGSIAYVNQPLVYYRQHGSNAKGWRARETFTERARSCFTNFSDRYANAEDCARARANILDRAKPKWHAIWYDRASIAASKYRHLAQQYADRRILYTAAEPSRRLIALMNIFSSGGYDQSHAYNLGPRSLLKDAVLGVLMGERLKSSREQATSSGAGVY